MPSLDSLIASGPLGVVCGVLLLVCKTLYRDLQTARENERQALLKLLGAKSSERSGD